MPLPPIDEFLALDALTLRDHTEQAGDAWDTEKHRASLAQLLAASECCCVRRHGALVAYAMLQPESADRWFVTGFNTHPQQRTAPVLRELFSALAVLLQRLGVAELRSHVYHTNHRSLAFHRRLGFRATRENARAVEFLVSVAELATHTAISPRSRTTAEKL